MATKDLIFSNEERWKRAKREIYEAHPELKRDEYGNIAPVPFEESEWYEKKSWEKTFEKVIVSFTDAVNLAEQLYPLCPFFYDKSKIWWIWNKIKRCWERTDETDILNLIDIALINPTGTTRSDLKNQIIEGLKRVGRKNMPKPIKKTWIQFENIIIDVITGDEIEPSPEYFSTNPIPYKVGLLEETPFMDRIFEQWVGKNYVQTLYEIIAYCCLPDYPIHRIFCFNGVGCNGKGRFLALLEKFLGKPNTCTTNLDILINNRFESSRLYKKLLCTMGETSSSTLSKTDILKRLVGQDSIAFEFKGKDGFSDINYAKLLIATNSLPATTDKTIGFYRRWVLIDFPNIFPEGKDILDIIPEQEYSNLAKKSIRLLNELLNRGSFTNEGTIEDRTQKYEATSNIVSEFIRNFCKEEPEEYIIFSDFRRKLKEYMNKQGKKGLSNRVISKLLDIEGYGTERKSIFDEARDQWTTKIVVSGVVLI